MPLSRRELALQAFKTQLATIGVDVRVARNTRDAVTSPPAVVMIDGGESKADEENQMEDRYTLRVSVYGYVQATTDEALGTAISDLRARVVHTMLANPFLSGTVEYLRESGDAMDNPDYDEDLGRRPNAGFLVNFQLEYVTNHGDPYNGPS